MIALRAVVEFERFERNSTVEPVKATRINIIGNMTTRTRKTRRKAAMADRERFSRHRFAKGLNFNRVKNCKFETILYLNLQMHNKPF